MAHRVKRVRWLVLVFALAMLLGGAAALSAQEPAQPSNLHLFAERYSLTLYVGGSESASLTGLQWAVLGDDGQTKILTLADAFDVLVLNDGLAQPGTCFIYVEAGFSPVLPSDCLYTRTFRKEVARADVFWYNSLTNQPRNIAIYRDGHPTGTVCSATLSDCPFSYTPLTPLPTVTPTATVTPTPAATEQAGFRIVVTVGSTDIQVTADPLFAGAICSIGSVVRELDATGRALVLKEEVGPGEHTASCRTDEGTVSNVVSFEIKDSDGDGVIDSLDNCPNTPNQDQSDVDNDRMGDVCDPDIDGDGIVNASDECPAVTGPLNGCPLPPIASDAPCSIAPDRVNFINVRAGPSSDFLAVTSLSPERVYRVLAQTEYRGALWYQIYASDYIGWVSILAFIRIGGQNCPAATTWSAPESLFVEQPPPFLLAILTGRAYENEPANVYLYRNGAMRRLTDATDDVVSAALHWPSQRLAYIVAGDEGAGSSLELIDLTRSDLPPHFLFTGDDGLQVVPSRLVWLPDGLTLLATLQDEDEIQSIYAFDLSGGSAAEPGLWIQNASNPAIPGDGTALAFERGVPGQRDVYVTAVVDEQPQSRPRLVDPEGNLDCFMPAFRPVSSTDRVYFVCDDGGDRVLYVYDPTDAPEAQQVFSISEIARFGIETINSIAPGPIYEYLAFEDGGTIYLITNVEDDQRRRIDPMNFGLVNATNITWVMQTGGN